MIKSEKSAALKNEQAAMAKFFAQGVYNEKKVDISKNAEHSKLPKFKDSNP